MYLRWRRILPSWIDVVAVELPGRGGRLSDPFLEKYDQLVPQLCLDHAAKMQGAFAIFGHSMGALLAYGMAQHLMQKAGPRPIALLASGSPAPSRRDSERFFGKDTDEALIADLRKQGGTPQEVFSNTDLMRLTLDVLAADYRLCQSFQYQNVGLLPFPFPVHVLGGRHDDIDVERMEAWRGEAAGTFTLDWFDGGHFFIRHQEGQVLKLLTQRLAESSPGVMHASRAIA